MGLRNTKEMRMIHGCLNAPLACRLPKLGDTLMQRLKAIEQAHKDGHWQVAQHLEVSGDVEGGLARASDCLLYTSDAADDTPCVDL
eukprot:376019-Pyramimonas_sp.AAC.1